MQNRLTPLVRADLTRDGGSLRLICPPGFKKAAKVTLIGADGRVLSAACLCHGESLKCKEVQGWSVEKPRLYRVEMAVEGEATVSFMTGFTAIEADEGKVFFNFKPLKLWGLNYHQILHGAALMEQLKLFKSHHVNYLRSLYAPFDEECLSMCDELGFYVEQCTKKRDVGQSGPAVQNAPDDQADFIEEAQSMVITGMHHPCVVLWCLGNDSAWGGNFAAARKKIKALDEKRLVNFHYPMTIPEEEDEPDVWSVTYVHWQQPMDAHLDSMVVFHTHGANNPAGYAVGQAAQSKKPVLHTEFAHIPCYNQAEIEKDTGIHEFYGESIRRFAAAMGETPNCLGGAVMAAVDEANFPWGVLDAEGTPKPELFHLGKAYAAAETAQVKAHAVPAIKKAAGRKLMVREDEETLTVQNADFEWVFKKVDGLLEKACVHGETLLCGGPFLQATRLTLEAWQGEIESVAPDGEAVRVTILGRYGETCRVRFTLYLKERGEMNCRCDILQLGHPAPPRVKAGIGLDAGGLNELGIAYLADSKVNQLAWSRRAPFADYPTGHIGRPYGKAHRNDMRDFTSQKHDIHWAVISKEGGAGALTGEGVCAIRLEPLHDPALTLDDRDSRIQYTGDWLLMDDYSGNFADTETLSKTAGDTAALSFRGTGVRVYGARDTIYGIGEASVDGGEWQRFDQYLKPVDFPAASRGYEKRYGQLIFEADGLKDGEHTLMLRVTGDKNLKAQQCYLALDKIEIVRHTQKDPVRIILNCDYNYARIGRNNYTRPMVALAHRDCICAAITLVKCETGKESEK